MQTSFLGNKKQKSVFQTFLEDNKLIHYAFKTISKNFPSVFLQYDTTMQLFHFLYKKKNPSIKLESIFTEDFSIRLLRKMDQNKFVNVKHIFKVIFLDFLKGINKKDFFWNSLDKLHKADSLNGGQWTIYQFISGWNVMISEIIAELVNKKVISSVEDIMNPQDSTFDFGQIFSKSLTKWTVEDFEIFLELFNYKINLENKYFKLASSYVNSIDKRKLSQIMHKIITQGLVKIDKKDLNDVLSKISKVKSLGKKSPKTIVDFLSNILHGGSTSDDFKAQIKKLFPIVKKLGLVDHLDILLFKEVKRNEAGEIQIPSEIQFGLATLLKGQLKWEGNFNPMVKEKFYSDAYLIMHRILNYGLLSKPQSVFGSKENIKHFVVFIYNFFKNEPKLATYIGRIQDSIEKNPKYLDHLANALFIIVNKPLAKNKDLNWNENTIWNLFKILDPTISKQINKEMISGFTNGIFAPEDFFPKLKKLFSELFKMKLKN